MGQLELLDLPDSKDLWGRQATWVFPDLLVYKVLVVTLVSRVLPVNQAQPDPLVPRVLPVPLDQLALRVMLVQLELPDCEAREDLRDLPAVREFKEFRVVLEALV